MAAVKFMTDLDYNHNAAKNIVIENLAADPAVADSVAGQIYYNTTNKGIRQFDGTQWKEFASDLSFSTGLKEESNVVSLKPATAAEIGGVTVAPVATSNLTLDANGALVSQAATNTQPGSIRIATDAETAETVTIADALETVAVNPKQLRTLHAHTGHKLTMEMDDKTFIVTTKLLGEDDVVLSSATLDLPLEQIIVKVEYDNTNEKFVFTLKDGSTLEVPATGILKGVVTQTATQDLTNKTIDADSNTIKNLEVDNFKDGVVRTSTTKIRDVDEAEDDKLVTEKAAAQLVENQLKGKGYDSPALTPASGEATWTIDISALGDFTDAFVCVKESGVIVYPTVTVNATAKTVVITMNSTTTIAAGTYHATVLACKNA